MCRHIPCLALFLFGLSCEPFFAQEAVYESRVDLVRLGVSVVDEDGSPVTDLRREDFQVFEMMNLRLFSIFQTMLLPI